MDRPSDSPWIFLTGWTPARAAEDAFRSAGSESTAFDRPRRPGADALGAEAEPAAVARWILDVSAFAEHDPVATRAVAYDDIAAAAGVPGSGPGVAIAVPAGTRAAPCIVTTGQTSRLTGRWASSGNTRGRLIAVMPKPLHGAYLLAAPTGARSDGHPSMTGLDGKPPNSVTLHLLNEAEALPLDDPNAADAIVRQLRRLDDAIALGLFRRVAGSAAKEARDPDSDQWAAELAQRDAAELCLDYEAAVALVFGLAFCEPLLDPPLRALTANLCRYRVSQVALRAAIRRHAAASGQWPSPDWAVAGLLEQARANRASGGTPNQILDDLNATLTHRPSALEAFFDLVQHAGGDSRMLDRRMWRLRNHLLRARTGVQATPQTASMLALALQAAFTARSGPPQIGEGFLATRLWIPDAPLHVPFVPQELRSLLLARN